MNPVAVGLLVVAFGVAPFALTDPAFNTLDVLGVVCAITAIWLTIKNPKEQKK